MTSKQAVRDCIHFQHPAWLPLFFKNKDQDKSDILMIGYDAASSFTPQTPGEDEWGVVWEDLNDGTMGQPVFSPLAGDIQKLDNYRFLDPEAAGRFDEVRRVAGRHRDRYLIGDLRLSGFCVLTGLRGFSAALEDLYLEPEFFRRLLSAIAEVENGLIRNFIAAGMDGIAFYDDWGSQQGLIISPAQWREFFAPVYRQQFDLIHSLGGDVYFHSCGDVRAILDDLIDLGADVLNLNQPDIFPMEWLSERYRGRVCFNCPVDHQTVAVHGNDADIHAYVDALCEKLASPKGGYIGYIEEYSCVGVSDENYRSISRAFEGRKHNAYPPKEAGL
jgi:hypothetical protein